MISVDLAFGEPAFAQIRSQIAIEIQTGALLPGQKLPSIRQLAGDLGLSAGTVARAYAELEAAGIVETNRRGGTVISRRAESYPSILDQASDFADSLKGAGLTLEEGIIALRAAWLSRD